MRVTMVKKRLGDGSPCRKCIQSEEMLRNRGLWERIDEVVWADEDDPESPGMRLAARYGIDVAPFFVVEAGENGASVYRSVLKLVRERLDAPPPPSPPRVPAVDPDDLAAARARLADAPPQEILRWGLERFGADLAVAFSGAEDVALIDMAADLGLPFAVFSIDTGRLHPETHELLDRVRGRYGIEIDIVSPAPAELEPFVRTKGLFSFYEDGHAECCGIRKVAPLRRALSTRRAWATGQRRDQSPDTRAAIAAVEVDAAFTGAGGVELVKLNPLAAWTSEEVWDYIRARGVPFNALHEQGYRSIGCAPCTRPVLPGQHEREGRWWWERAEARECGLHAGNSRRSR